MNCILRVPDANFRRLLHRTSIKLLAAIRSRQIRLPSFSHRHCGVVYWRPTRTTMSLLNEILATFFAYNFTLVRGLEDSLLFPSNSIVPYRRNSIHCPSSSRLIEVGGFSSYENRNKNERLLLLCRLPSAFGLRLSKSAGNHIHWKAKKKKELSGKKNFLFMTQKKTMKFILQVGNACAV